MIELDLSGLLCTSRGRGIVLADLVEFDCFVGREHGGVIELDLIVWFCKGMGGVNMVDLIVSWCASI